MSEQERALLTVVARWPRVDGEQALLIVVAGLYAIAAFTLWAAPDAQLFTQGTRPVFALFPPHVWAVAFLIGFVCTAMLLRRVTGGRQLATWLMVLPTQVVWLVASLIAVSHGGGSAMGVVFLTAVLAFTVVTALIVASAWFIRVTTASTVG